MELVMYATLPMILLTGLGNILRRCMITANEAWSAMGKLAYNVAFPALLITDLSQVRLSNEALRLPIAVAIAATVLVSLITFSLKRVFSIDGPTFTSFFQGSVRYNSYVYLAVAQPLYGARGVAIAACFIAVMIVVTNCLSVAVLDKYGEGRGSNGVGILQTLKNPVILATIVGVFLNYTHIALPAVISISLNEIGAISLPLSLLIVGAGIRGFGSSMFRPLVIAACALKLLLLPALTLTLSLLLHVNGLSRDLAVLYGAVPTAGNAYILAEQMGGDTETMAAIISASIVLSIPTMMLCIVISRIFV